MFTGQTAPATPTISCSSGSPSASSWNNLPPSTLNTATTYSPTPNALTCGGQTPSNTPSCGTLTVKTAPAINQCNFTNTSGTTGSSITKPSITLTDPSNVCSNNGSNAPNNNWTDETWTYTTPSSGTFNWGSLPAAGTYNNFSVSGSCGGYSVPSITCTGQVTVSAASGGTTLNLAGCANNTQCQLPVAAGTYTISCTSCNCSVTGGNVTYTNGQSITFSSGITIYQCW
jgi:hypothetical protein